MRCSRRKQGRKGFEYLVDELSIWITEDQMRTSLSPALLSQLRESPPHPLRQHSLGSILCIQHLRSITSTAMLHQPLEVPVPLLQPARHRAASLNRGSGGRSAGARTRIQRSAAKPISPSTAMAPTIQATRTHDLQNDESHAQSLL